MEKIHKNILIVDDDCGFAENIKHTLLSALRGEHSDALHEFYIRHLDNIDEAEEHLISPHYANKYDLIVIDGLVIDMGDDLSSPKNRTQEEIMEVEEEIQKIGYSYSKFILTVRKTQKKNIPIILITTSPNSIGLPGTRHSFVKGYGKGMFPGHKNEHAQTIRDLVLK